MKTAADNFNNDSAMEEQYSDDSHEDLPQQPEAIAGSSHPPHNGAHHGGGGVGGDPHQSTSRRRGGEKHHSSSMPYRLPPIPRRADALLEKIVSNNLVVEKQWVSSVVAPDLFSQMPKLSSVEESFAIVDPHLTSFWQKRSEKIAEDRGKVMKARLAIQQEQARQNQLRRNHKKLPPRASTTEPPRQGDHPHKQKQKQDEREQHPQRSSSSLSTAQVYGSRSSEGSSQHRHSSKRSRSSGAPANSSSTKNSGGIPLNEVAPTADEVHCLTPLLCPTTSRVGGTTPCGDLLKNVDLEWLKDMIGSADATPQQKHQSEQRKRRESRRLSTKQSSSCLSAEGENADPNAQHRRHSRQRNSGTYSSDEAEDNDEDADTEGAPSAAAGNANQSQKHSSNKNNNNPNGKANQRNSGGIPAKLRTLRTCDLDVLQDDPFHYSETIPFHHAILNSPRSTLVLVRNGVTAYSLLRRPPDFYVRPSETVKVSVLQLRYSLAENERLILVESLRSQYDSLCGLVSLQSVVDTLTHSASHTAMLAEAKRIAEERYRRDKRRLERQISREQRASDILAEKKEIGVQRAMETDERIEAQRLAHERALKERGEEIRLQMIQRKENLEAMREEERRHVREMAEELDKKREAKAEMVAELRAQKLEVIQERAEANARRIRESKQRLMELEAVQAEETAAYEAAKKQKAEAFLKRKAEEHAELLQHAHDEDQRRDEVQEKGRLAAEALRDKIESKLAASEARCAEVEQERQNDLKAQRVLHHVRERQAKAAIERSHEIEQEQIQRIEMRAAVAEERHRQHEKALARERLMESENADYEKTHRLRVVSARRRQQEFLKLVGATKLSLRDADNDQQKALEEEVVRQTRECSKLMVIERDVGRAHLVESFIDRDKALFAKQVAQQKAKLNASSSSTALDPSTREKPANRSHKQKSSTDGVSSSSQRQESSSSSPSSRSPHRSQNGKRSNAEKATSKVDHSRSPVSASEEEEQEVAYEDFDVDKDSPTASAYSSSRESGSQRKQKQQQSLRSQQQSQAPPPPPPQSSGHSDDEEISVEVVSMSQASGPSTSHPATSTNPIQHVVDDSSLVDGGLVSRHSTSSLNEQFPRLDSRLPSRSGGSRPSTRGQDGGGAVLSRRSSAVTVVTALAPPSSSSSTVRTSSVDATPHPTTTNQNHQELNVSRSSIAEGNEEDVYSEDDEVHSTTKSKSSKRSRGAVPGSPSSSNPYGSDTYETDVQSEYQDEL